MMVQILVPSQHLGSTGRSLEFKASLVLWIPGQSNYTEKPCLKKGGVAFWPPPYFDWVVYFCVRSECGCAHHSTHVGVSWELAVSYTVCSRDGAHVIRLGSKSRSHLSGPWDFFPIYSSASCMFCSQSICMFKLCSHVLFVWFVVKLYWSYIGTI